MLVIQSALIFIMLIFGIFILYTKTIIDRDISNCQGTPEQIENLKMKSELISHIAIIYITASIVFGFCKMNLCPINWDINAFIIIMAILNLVLISILVLFKDSCTECSKVLSTILLSISIFVEVLLVGGGLTYFVKK